MSGGEFRTSTQAIKSSPRPPRPSTGRSRLAVAAAARLTSLLDTATNVARTSRPADVAKRPCKSLPTVSGADGRQSSVPRRKSRRSKTGNFKEFNATPLAYSGRMYPTNHLEQKERFLRYGIEPDFQLRKTTSKNQAQTVKQRAEIRFDHYREAKSILDTVREKFGDGTSFLQETYGSRVDQDAATDVLTDYVAEHKLDGKLTIYWTPELTCSARMMWHGPPARLFKPEARRFTLIIKNSSENQFLRQRAVRCLADHEIGTHFFRMYNDGFQPWYRCRRRFELRSSTSREFAATEEGLAAVNTLLNAEHKYLWSAALIYYTACRATKLTFKELYDDLARYITDCEQRWKSVMRVKRGMTDDRGLGGYGGDQCYLEGAINILSNIDTVDWPLLYAGKICVDEARRVRRVARRDLILLPHFLADIDRYRSTLHEIAALNGLAASAAPSPIPPPSPLDLHRAVKSMPSGFVRDELITSSRGARLPTVKAASTGSVPPWPRDHLRPVAEASSSSLPLGEDPGRPGSATFLSAVKSTMSAPLPSSAAAAPSSRGPRLQSLDDQVTHVRLPPPPPRPPRPIDRHSLLQLAILPRQPVQPPAVLRRSPTTGLEGGGSGGGSQQRDPELYRTTSDDRLLKMCEESRQCRKRVRSAIRRLFI